MASETRLTGKCSLTSELLCSGKAWTEQRFTADDISWWQNQKVPLAMEKGYLPTKEKLGFSCAYKWNDFMFTTGKKSKTNTWKWQLCQRTICLAWQESLATKF